MTIHIGADHGGFELKNKIVEMLKAQEYAVEDHGPESFDENDDYPDFAHKVALAVSQAGMDDDLNHKALGILICRSGNGMCIAANKVIGAYAALCFSKKHAEMARRHDNANILCLDSDYDGEDPAEIVKTFIQTDFETETERHVRRFKKILSIEQN